MIPVEVFTEKECINKLSYNTDLISLDDQEKRSLWIRGKFGCTIEPNNMKYIYIKCNGKVIKRIKKIINPVEIKIPIFNGEVDLSITNVLVHSPIDMEDFDTYYNIEILRDGK